VSSKDIKVEMTTLHEIATPDLETQPLSITYVPLDRLYELSSILFNLLPKFHRLLGDDPHCHINEFIMAMKPEEITQDQIRSRSFPFSP